MNSRSLASLLFCAAFGIACGGSKAATKPAGAPTRDEPVAAKMPETASCSDENKTGNAQPADVDGDGRPEVVKYYQDVDDPERPGQKKSALMRQDIDLNWDGRLDVCRYFSAAGVVVREELDLDYDARVDDVRWYEEGTIVRSERDRNNDGRADVIRRYKAGKLTQKEVDTNEDGQPDRWEYFDGDRLERVGVDMDHDGKVDRWSKAGS